MEVLGGSGEAVNAVAEDQFEVLIESRDRTLALIAGLDEHQLSAVVDPLLSPLLWDLGHIANFEQRFLLTSSNDEFDDIYNPFAHARAKRGELPMLGGEECFRYMGAVRDRVVERFEEFDPALVELVIQHEQQHNETMLQALRQLEGYTPPAALTDAFVPPPSAPGHIRLREAASRAYRPIARGRSWIMYPGGDYLIGNTTEHEPLVYDNERAAHPRTVDAFEIAVRPVTCGEFADWIAAGGYHDLEYWSEAGRAWLAAQEPGFLHAPLGWHPESEGWTCADFGRPRPIDRDAPVCHVNWFEAEAYARASGARLPSEFEWEVAASYEPRTGAAGHARRHSWGDRPWVPGAANLDQLAFGTLPVGSADHGSAPIDMNGQVWEWTASEFSAYPGFEPFAYREYSAPFFDAGYRVLRGGSWATSARSVSNTFRNWDRPERRQIFAGFRLARGAVTPRRA